MSVLGFYFPPESGEKVSLEITILMSLTFFMQVVNDMQPPSSDIPLISTYFTCIMVMVASSVVSNDNKYHFNDKNSMCLTEIPVSY